MPTHNKISTWRRINRAVIADKKNNPSWPDHVVAQAAKVGAAAGDLIKESLVVKYGEIDHEKDTEKLESAAVDIIVKTLRFLDNLKK